LQAGTQEIVFQALWTASDISSYQHRVHQRCLASRSLKEYPAEAGKRFTTSRSSSLSSIHACKRPSPQRGHLDSESIISKVNHKPVIEILEFGTKETSSEITRRSSFWPRIFSRRSAAFGVSPQAPHIPP